MHFFSFLLPLAINLIRGYISNSDSKRDDEILGVVQDSLFYLYNKQNNDVNLDDINNIFNKKIKGF